MDEIYDLFRKVQKGPLADPVYLKKMMHDVPDAPVVDREKYITEKCTGKRIMHLGSSSGELNDKLSKIAKVIGVDRDKSGNPDILCDLDGDLKQLIPAKFEEAPIELIVAGEIIEHLGNPGRLLSKLRTFQCPLLITVPNAFAEANSAWIQKNKENVNIDHVSWYSYRTMRTLLERYAFTIKEFYYYTGKPKVAEGLIFFAE